jgi:CBS domain-containing protein
VVKETNYKELKSGKIEINGMEVPASPLSSIRRALKIAEELKSWIERGDFLLTEPVKRLPSRSATRPLEIRRPSIMVRELESKPVIITHQEDDLKDVARKMVDNNINHIPVVDSEGVLRGIVTSWDIADAVARGKRKLRDIMTRKVVVARENEPVDVVARRIDKYNISGLPIVDDENRVKGIVTAEDISRLIGKVDNRGESI